MLFGVPDLKLLDRLPDRRLLVGCLDVAEELPAFADERDLPAMYLLGGWLLRAHASSLPYQTAAVPRFFPKSKTFPAGADGREQWSAHACIR
jgi:hypothetical protein